MSVAEDVARLDALDLEELRRLWVRLTGTTAPRISARMLRLALAWEIQASAYGGLPRAVTAALDQLARGTTRTKPPCAGMRLVREWGDRVHVVTIGGDTGQDEIIRWDGREWHSLSEVARAITGTRWSGPAFLGLKRKAAVA